MKERLRLDVAHLPTAGFGTRSPMAWGTMGFILLEGVGFALALGAYFYLQTINSQWPLSAPPPTLAAGILLTVVMLASGIPNHLVKRYANEEKILPVRIGLVLMSLIGLGLVAIRAFEFPALNIGWDANAYGSILWLLLGLHTAHLATDVVDTMVLAALSFTRHFHGTRRFADVEDNAVYWDFVVLSWLPIYAVIYWVPRW